VISETQMRTATAPTPLHILTLTPFFPFVANPVYGTYVSEPVACFGEFGLRSTVIGVSPLHHARRLPAASAPAQWMRYPSRPGNAGLTTAGLFLYWRLLRFVSALHRRNPIDVIHAHGSLPCGQAAMLLAKRFGVPFVVTIHGLDVFNACFEPGTSGADRRAQVSSQVYRHAASVICISHAVESILKSGMADPISSCVIYNGADPSVFFPEEAPPPDRVPTVLMVGNLLQIKGHETVFKAIAQLTGTVTGRVTDRVTDKLTEKVTDKVTPRFQSLRCTVIGEGPDRARLEGVAQSLGIADRVSFLGRQDRPAVARAMRESTIFALPSRYEGLGCVYLEAMASAKPVIACEGQGIAEIIRHGQNGWLIPVDGVQEMADALCQLLGSADLRAQIGAAARQTILEGLTVSDQARHLADLYRAVKQTARQP